MSDYPDVSDILRRKVEGRRELARLGFWEKVERMEALRERLSELKTLRKDHKRARSELPS